MKLLFIDTKPIRRGAQVFLHDLSNSMIAKGNPVRKVYLYNEEGAARLELNEDDVVLGGDDKHVFEKFPTFNPFLLGKLSATIREWNPDLILLNGSRTLKYGAALKQISGIKTPLVYRIIDSVSFWNPHAYKQLYYRKLVMPSIDAAIGVSKASLSDVQKLHRFAKPAKAITRAISTKNFEKAPTREAARQKHGVSADEKVILFLGNLTTQKRPDRYLQAMHLLQQKHSNVKGWIVGDGVLNSETKHLAHELKLTNQIKFWGYQQNVGDFIAAADVLMLSSDTEGLPGVVLEAGYFGVPTVSTNVGGIKECLDDAITGFITDRNAEELAERVGILVSDEQLRVRLGNASKKKVEEGFTIEKIANSYVDFLEELRVLWKRK